MGTSEKCKIWISAFLSLGISLFLYIFLYKLFPIVYAINDDVAMRDIASGKSFFEGDAHLVFIKYPLGFFINWLYRTFVGYDWYGILMTGFILMSLGIVLYRGLSDIKTRKNKFIYVFLTLMFFACIGLRHVVIFQWTMTAGILGATGVFFFYTSSEQNKLKCYIEEAIAALLLILSFCIRHNILLMIIPVLGICYFFKYIKIDRDEKKFLTIRRIWFWIVVVCGCGIVMLIDKMAYQEQGWKQYREYNIYRSEIYDYYGIPSYQDHEEFYASIGMGEEDVVALKNYSLLLVDGIFEYKMKAIAEYAKENYMEQEDRGKQIVKGIAAVGADLQSGTYAPLNWLEMVLLICTISICYTHKSHRFQLLFVCLGIQVLLWCYLGFKGRIVERVSFAMYLYMFMITAGILYKELMENGISYKVVEWREYVVILSGLSIILMTSLLTCYEVKKEAAELEKKNEEYIQLCDYMGRNSAQIYFIHTNSIDFYEDNFRIRRNFEGNNIVHLGGWLTFSPIEIQKREQLGVANVKEAFCKKDNIYVLSRDNIDMAYIENCLKDDYGSRRLSLLDTITFKDYFYTIEKFE